MTDDRDDDLLARAGDVLDGNWIGASTKPAPRLYPHQWSWDSAFIAIGNAHRRWDRAVEELRSLFAAQWSNGMVPHIVFDAEVGDYFPSAADWSSGACPAAPAGIATSGMCQPPVHATAVRKVFEARPDAEAMSFLGDLLEPLRMWHGYLFDERCVGGDLVEIWHPWESGMDNSPAWDEPMASMSFRPDDVPPYRRVDTSLADPADRPTDAEYDRYVYIVDRLRREHYTPSDPSSLPFRVRDVLFNSALARAERDLAHIADTLGDDGSAERDRAASLMAAIDRDLWSDEHGQHVSVDVVAGRQIPMPIAGGIVALLAEPDPEHRRRIVRTLDEEFLVPIGDDAAVMPTVPVTHERFEPTRYWRGPVWIQMMWLVIEGLESVGEHELAARMRRGVFALIEEAGFGEYFDPIARRGCGSDRFSWSAALTIDLAARRRD